MFSLLNICGVCGVPQHLRVDAIGSGSSYVYTSVGVIVRLFSLAGYARLV